MSDTKTEPKSPSDILWDVQLEIERQRKLKVAGKFRFSCQDDIPLSQKLAILMEEIGEVAECVVEAEINEKEGWLDDLQTELIQVAAVATAWASTLPVDKPKD